MKTAQNIIEVGKRLIQAKSLVQHGQWQDWLQLNFQLGQSAANKFMSCAERFGNSDTYPNLKSSQMVALLSLPDAAETEKFIAEKAAEGKKVADMTIKKLGVAQEVVKIKLHDAQITAEQVTFAKVKLGELLAALPKATKDNNLNGRAGKENNQIDSRVDLVKTKAESIAELGITQKQAERLQVMAKNQEAVQSAMAKAREQKLREGQEIGKLVLLAEARLGELFNQMPKAKENQYTKSGISSCEEKANLETEKPKPKMEVAAQMVIDDRADAKIWILKNQLGRRNLSAYDRSILALKLKPVIAAKAKEQQIRKPADSVLQKSAEQKPIDTRQEIAKAAGVSHDTIAKVEKIEQQATPEIKAAVTSSLTTYLAISEENHPSWREKTAKKICKAQFSNTLTKNIFLKHIILLDYMCLR